MKHWTQVTQAECEATEMLYADALEMIATGETREATRGRLIDTFTGFDVEDINAEIEDALKDALRQGVEREDIDPSWFA